jgi:hypothetical protein
MTKKSRKPNLPQETLARARRELYGGSPAPDVVETKPGEEKPKPVAAPIVRKPKPMTTEADLRQEYAYVVSDLQNMGILAAAMMMVLVIMSFFI